MKKIVNHILNLFNLEIHGIGYIRKLQKSGLVKDAFISQKEFLGTEISVIFDVGSNRGIITNKYHDLFSQAYIHAFEPFESFHSLFLQNTSHIQSVKLNGIALSDTNGIANFYVNKSHDTNSLLESTSIGANSDTSCTSVSSIQVRTQRLEDYCLQNSINEVDILKLDTQGAELAILKGSESLLREKKIKLIYTECYFKPQYKDQPLFYDIAKYLQQFGYHLEDLYDPFYNDRLLLWSDAIFLPIK